MLNLIKRWLAPPVFEEDEEKTRLSAIFNTILIALIIIVLAGEVAKTIGSIVFDQPAYSSAPSFTGLALCVIFLIMIRWGQVKLASFLLAFLQTMVITGGILTSKGVEDPAASSYLFAIVVAGLLLGGRAALGFTGLTILCLAGVIYARSNGWVEAVTPPVPAWIMYPIVFSMIGFLLSLASNNIQTALNRARRNEQEVTKSYRDLQVLQATLEERVVTRTRGLELVTLISKRLTGILDFDHLLAELVNQVKEGFDYYHVHIYILDEQSQNLVMSAGYGQPGAQMKAEGHHIPLQAPTSLVARAARSGEVISIENVRQAPDWLPNPLLPDTHSEMAVPIVLEDRVVGVLDVQTDEVAGLDEGDANVLDSLANQVAIAIRNARLFAEVEATLTESREAQERYLAQAWQQAKVVPKRLEWLYTRPGSAELAEEDFAKAKDQALTQQQATIVSLNGQEAAETSVVAPVTLGGQQIGALQLHQIDEEADWTEQDLALVEAVLDQVAQTAENLRLFDETRQRASQEQTIREITDKLRTAPNLERLLKVAAEQLGQHLSADHAKLELGIEPEPIDGNGSSGKNGHPTVVEGEG